MALGEPMGMIMDRHTIHWATRTNGEPLLMQRASQARCKPIGRSRGIAVREKIAEPMGTGAPMGIRMDRQLGLPVNKQSATNPTSSLRGGRNCASIFRVGVVLSSNEIFGLWRSLPPPASASHGSLLRPPLKEEVKQSCCYLAGHPAFSFRLCSGGMTENWDVTGEKIVL